MTAAGVVLLVPSRGRVIHASLAWFSSGRDGARFAAFRGFDAGISGLINMGLICPSPVERVGGVRELGSFCREPGRPGYRLLSNLRRVPRRCESCEPGRVGT